MARLILAPAQGEAAYQKAAEAFQELYQKITGNLLPVTTEDDNCSDLVVIGSDAVNDFAMDAMLKGEIENLGIRYGTDDYCIRACNVKGRKILLLAGGRGRSTLYAVYDFFETQAGCHYFWDGDVIPQAADVPMEGMNRSESPRFQYRGLRYFAHRGLKRFQAEHWSLADWKREIDWMLKKRLNMFMLRIGMDDLWQRAFPDIVPYPNPNGPLPEAMDDGFDDRNLFWPLEFRGILRQKLLAYAEERDLIHLEDCGTMSHWYSRTPRAFLDREKPDLLDQASVGYKQDTGLVWDIRIQRNMDNYMKLTDTFVRDFNPHAGIFHTIGMAERNMYENRDDNLRLKLFGYRKIAQNLRERYPNSKLMIASWDFIGWWKPEEVQQLIKELDPDRTLILDYTSESDDPAIGFQNWGIVGKFPWIFGLFHAYEAESSLRGIYDTSTERLAIAAEDPFCKGMILWPELSHSDPLVLEYLTENAWSPLSMSLEQLTERFCTRRYGQLSGCMNETWQDALPIIKLVGWGGYSRREKGDPDWEKYVCSWTAHCEMWTDSVIVFPDTLNDDHMQAHFRWQLSRSLPLLPKAVTVLRRLAELPASAWEDPFVRRDAIDLARTMTGRFLNLALMEISVRNGQGCKGLADRFMELMGTLRDMLDLHPDYSMLATLKAINETCPVPASFEKTLKHNLVNGYCRQYASEPMQFLFPEECRLVLDWVCEPAEGRGKADLMPQRAVLLQKFMDTPLEQMQPETVPEPSVVMRNAADQLENLFD